MISKLLPSPSRNSRSVGSSALADAALIHALVLELAAYERLHDEGLGPEVGADFVVERVGQQTEGVEDVGVEFYRYVGGR